MQYRGLHALRIYSPPSVDRIWGIWGSYYNIPKAIFNLLKGDCRVLGFQGPKLLSRMEGQMDRKRKVTGKLGSHRGLGFKV